MKKLLILVMVLAMASLANATIVSITGPSTIALGGTAAYTVSQSGTPAIGSADIDAVADLATKGTLSAGAIVATGRDTTTDYIGAPFGTNSNGYEFSAANLTSGVALGTNLFTFTLTATGTLGQIIALSMVENSFYDATFVQIPTGSVGLQGMNVTITPEPMTIALLGLGGLFLRRRMA